MLEFTGKELDIIKYSLKIFHNRDLSSFYSNETIDILENVMKKLDIDFIPQSEIDKKKVNEYILCYNNDKVKITINKIDKRFISNIIFDEINEIARKNNIQYRINCI